MLVAYYRTYRGIDTSNREVFMTSQSVEAPSLAASQGSSTKEGPTLLSVEEARSRIIDAIRPLNGMRIELGSALGRALAEDTNIRPHL
jgi:hypothetical protein